MLVYYFVPFIVSTRYLLFWVSNGHNSVTVQNRTHVYMNFFYHKDLGNHLLQLCPKVVKHPVYCCRKKTVSFYFILIYRLQFNCPEVKHLTIKIRTMLLSGFTKGTKHLRVSGVGNQIYSYRRKPVYCISLYFLQSWIGFRGFAIIRRNSQRNVVKAVSFEYGGNCNYIFQFILASKTLICGDFFFQKIKWRKQIYFYKERNIKHNMERD